MREGEGDDKVKSDRNTAKRKTGKTTRGMEKKEVEETMRRGAAQHTCSMLIIQVHVTSVSLLR